MKYGAAVDQKNERGSTALHYAIGCDYDSFTSRLRCESMKTNTSTVEALLSAGADVNAMDASGYSPLYLACERGEHEIVKLLLSRGANPNVKATKRPKYPIHAACRRQHYDLIKLLLEVNADVAVRGECGKTALHGVLESTSRQSSDSGDASVLDMVQLLLDRGANVNAVSADGETPFYVACSKGLTPVVDKMLECGAKLDGSSGKKLPLIVACRNKHVPVVQLLLSNGANPDISEAGGNRWHRALPLHIAAADSSSELLELLLKHGASVNITDEEGSTALHRGVEEYRVTTSPYADEAKATSNAKSAVDILLENRADVNIVNDRGETPLYTAVSKGLLDIVSKMLQKYGGNPNILPSKNKSALVAACEKRNVDLVDMLLKNGADPNLTSVSQSGWESKYLPLSTAAAQGNSDDIIVLLINAGADVNAINSEGKTVLCTATETMMNRYRYESSDTLLSTARLLLEHGADLNVLRPDGRSLLYLLMSTIGVAQRRGYPTPLGLVELLQLLVKHGAILSDVFSLLKEDVDRQSQRVLQDLATFDGSCQLVVDLFRAGAGFQVLARCCESAATLPREARSIRLCQAAVLAGYTPGSAELQDLQSATADRSLLDQLANWMNEDRQNVPSLLRLCRVVIRKQLSVAAQHRSILPAIDKLPLPNTVKMYLQFDGTLTEVDLSVNKELCNEETSAENRRQLVGLSVSAYAGSDSDNDFYYDSDSDYWRYHRSDSDDDDFRW